MPDPRTFVWFGRHAGAQFRCRVCRRFVRATDRGVCPSCGMPPAEFTPVSTRVTGPERSGQRQPRWWRAVRWPGLGYGLLVGLPALALALRVLRC